MGRVQMGRASTLISWSFDLIHFQCHKLFHKNKYRWKSSVQFTVWKFKKFSGTLILREINSIYSWSPKDCHIKVVQIAVFDFRNQPKLISRMYIKSEWQENCLISTLCNFTKLYVKSSCITQCGNLTKYRLGRLLESFPNSIFHINTHAHDYQNGSNKKLSRVLAF